MQVSIPVAIGIISAYLEERGVKTKVFDEEITSLTPNILRELTKDLEQPYIFGFTCMTAHVVRGYQLTKMLKTLFPDCYVVAGGLQATAMPEEPLSYGADFVVRGEGEEVMYQLINAIRCDKDYSKVKGITYKCEGKIIHNGDAELIADLDSIPVFPYKDFEHPKYDRGFMVSSRGCPYRCNYCSIRMMNGTTYRYLSADRIVSELDILINRYGQKQIMFYDDNFCFKKRRVIELCDAMIKSGLNEKCAFSIQTRADNFYPEVVPMMAAAGFKSAGFGMETGIDRLHHIINKEETVQQHQDAIDLAKKHGMTTSLFMIFGLPTETHDDRRKSFVIVDRMGTTESKYNNLIPYPGTPMFKSLSSSDRLHIAPAWSNFNSVLSITHSIFDKTPLPYVPETSSEWELKRDIVLFNLKTYFNPRVLKGMLKGKKGMGWTKLPKNWYFKPAEIYHLTKTVFALATNLIIAYLPLWITEPIMTALNPAMKKRGRIPNAPKDIKIEGWDSVSAMRYRPANQIKVQEPRPTRTPAA